MLDGRFLSKDNNSIIAPSAATLAHILSVPFSCFIVSPFINSTTEHSEIFQIFHLPPNVNKITIHCCLLRVYQHFYRHSHDLTILGYWSCAFQIKVVAAFCWLFHLNLKATKQALKVSEHHFRLWFINYLRVLHIWRFGFFLQFNNFIRWISAISTFFTCTYYAGVIEWWQRKQPNRLSAFSLHTTIALTEKSHLWNKSVLILVLKPIKHCLVWYVHFKITIYLLFV